MISWLKERYLDNPVPWVTTAIALAVTLAGYTVSYFDPELGAKVWTWLIVGCAVGFAGYVFGIIVRDA